VKFAVEIVVVIVVVMLVITALLRFRKLRRDESRDLAKPVELRLVAPPPSPYETSKGFRLLGKDGVPESRPAVERPRLDPDRHYVFNDAMSGVEDFAAFHSRHSDRWFLSRSSHRSALSILSRRMVVVILAVVVIVVVATYYVTDHSKKNTNGSANLSTTTLRTSSSATTTSTPMPSAFVATSTTGDDATYGVPATKYQVTVTGSRGPTWTVYDMGPVNTLEWQGTIAQGHVESLPMTGNSRITIGSPSSAKVTVNGRPVVFPAPLPSTLILIFDAKPAGTTTST
jgi:uncharacterized protein YxeA